MKTQAPLRPDSTVLVSGGARGITARCVIELAHRVPCNFVLLGRSSFAPFEPAWAHALSSEAELKQGILADLRSKGEKTTPVQIEKSFRLIQSRREIEATLRAVERAGGQAEYIPADITHASALEEALLQIPKRFGPVTGIIHGAGNLADKRIEKKSAQDFDAVVSPKVNGLENLLRCIPASRLDFLVLFSSIVAFYGNAGQADYALANEVLNKTALQIQREHPACRVLAIDWGPWDAGMVTPDLKRAFEEQHVPVIPAATGAHILADELTSPGRAAGQVIIGGLPARPAGKLATSGLQTHTIHRKLSLAANPFLYDHRIGEHAVLPATCAAAWVANTCEQIYPGYRIFSLSNFQVLKGIVFDQDLASEYILELKETHKDPAAGSVEVSALINSRGSRSKPVYHYRLQARLERDTPPAPVVAGARHLQAEAEQPVSGQELYRNGTLFHGPSFQGVDRVLRVSPGELTMQVALPEIDLAHQGQFPVQSGNPFIYDAIVQCLLIWAQYFYQAPCLPSSLEKLEQYRDIPFGQRCIVHMRIRSQSPASVCADIQVVDDEGKVYVLFTGLTGTISPALNRLIGKKSSES